MKPTIVEKCFVKFVNPNQPPKVVSSRDVSKLSLPKECEFYFFDAYVSICGGKEYIAGPESNVSPHYFKVEKYWPNVEHFRIYFMRCNGWSEDYIKHPEKMSFNVFKEYNAKEYPKGVVIVNQMICNPGTGVILSANKVIKKAIFPSKKVRDAYRNADE